MSLFMGGASAFEVNEDRVRLATTEYDSYVSLFTNIIDSCRVKCFPKYYTEEELAKGEMVCVDRCVSKFFKANLLIGEYFHAVDYNAADTPVARTTRATLAQTPGQAKPETES